MKTSGIGGQAVMEGVMMRNGSKYAIAVRKPDNTIEVKKDEYKSATSKNAFFRIPIIRGVVTFVDSMILGMKTLTYSAELVEDEENEEEPSAFEKFLIKIFKEKAADIVMGLVVIISILLAVGLFVLLPTFVAGLLGGIIKSSTKQILVEGVIRLILFLLYVWLISLMNEIKRTYMYHGAEHKCINCIESGKDLTVENVRESSRFHKRCGTSFIFIVVFLSIILFMFIRTDTLVLKVAFRLLLIPLIAGISYEFIRLAGSTESKVIDLLSQPGMWLQRITTKEPDDEMIAVGIASVEAVFDWKPFVEKMRKEEHRKSGKGFKIEADFDDSVSESVGDFEELEDIEDDPIHHNIQDDLSDLSDVDSAFGEDELISESEEIPMEIMQEQEVVAETEEPEMELPQEPVSETEEEKGELSEEILEEILTEDTKDYEDVTDSDNEDAEDYSDSDEEDSIPASEGAISENAKGFFSKFRKEKKTEKASEHITRHRTLPNYDEDYDESDELLAELDKMFENDKKEK